MINVQGVSGLTGWDSTKQVYFIKASEPKQVKIKTTCTVIIPCKISIKGGGMEPQSTKATDVF